MGITLAWCCEAWKLSPILLGDEKSHPSFAQRLLCADEQVPTVVTGDLQIHSLKNYTSRSNKLARKTLLLLRSPLVQPCWRQQAAQETGTVLHRRPDGGLSADHAT
jgi:hypothetical protein